MYKLIELTVPLLKINEGFRSNPYYDSGYWTWGYGTRWNPAKGYTITKEEAEKEMIEYLERDYEKLKALAPKWAYDYFAVPLLSKGYQYGAGIYKLYANLTLEQAIKEFNDEDDKQFFARRQRELVYYNEIKGFDIKTDTPMLKAVGLLAILFILVKR